MRLSRWIAREVETDGRTDRQIKQKGQVYMQADNAILMNRQTIRSRFAFNILDKQTVTLKALVNHSLKAPLSVRSMSYVGLKGGVLIDAIDSTDRTRTHK